MEGKICYQSIGTLFKALSALLGEDHLLPDKSIMKQAVEFVIHKKGVDIVISLDDNNILPHNKIWEIFARKDFIPYFLQKKRDSIKPSLPSDQFASYTCSIVIDCSRNNIAKINWNVSIITRE